ncbi:MAG: DUF4230 domain-containing protein [Bacteroidaceae bacterium]|nr:DUF4230 domain-containing protein [Bacteroidaceae bacterium]
MPQLSRLSCGLFVALLALTACQRSTAPASALADSLSTSAAQIDTLASLIRSVRAQSKLHTLEMQVHKVVLYADESKITSPLGNLKLPGHRKLAVPIDVTIKGAIDFARFDSAHVARSNGLLIVTLPDPTIEVTASRVDHKAVRQYVSLSRSNFSASEIDAFAQQGQDSIVAHLDQTGIVEATRESATRSLVPLFAQLGVPENEIVIRFRKQFSPAELRQFTLKQPAR